MTTHRVFVDADVLVSRTTRDWLFMLRHNTRMFQLHTTHDVIAETLSSWRNINPTANGKRIPELGEKIKTFVDEVLDDFPGDVAFHGKDKGDLHVKAAADHTRADILLTGNTKDFGDPDLLAYDLYTPDEFFCLVDDSSEALVRAVTMEQTLYWQAEKDKGYSVRGLVEMLRAAGCPNFANRVQGHLIFLGGPLSAK